MVFLHLKPTTTTWSERGDGEHARLEGRPAVAAASFLRDAWLGGVERETPAPLPWLSGAAFETRTPRRRIYGAAEGNGAVSAGSFRRTRTMAEGSGARGAYFLLRNCTRAEGNRARDTGSLRRCCTVRIYDRRRRSPWVRNGGNLCCIIGQAGNRYTSILQNERRVPRQCCRRAGRVCRTTVELSFAGAENSRLARVRVSARVVGSP